MKKYKYTLLKQDGRIEDLGVGEKKDFRDFYQILNCQMIELIPRDYYPDKSGHATIYGDEEGRFNEKNHRNPHMKVLRGSPMLGEPAEWDCVGDLIKEEVYKEGGKNG